MNAQLELGQHPNPSRRRRGSARAAKPKPEVCKCGHLREDHNAGTGRCHPCEQARERVRSEMGPLALSIDEAKRCAKFKSKKRIAPPTPLELLGPEGSFPVWRPDTKTHMVMGWGHIEEFEDYDDEDMLVMSGVSYAIYLAQLKAESPNSFHIATDPKLAHRIALGKKKRIADQADRACAAVRQLLEHEGAELVRPFIITLTRVSFGQCDGDNAVSSLKHVRDGVCRALDFDDAALVTTTEDCPPLLPSEKVWIRYEQGHSFKSGVFGVRIEIEWRDL